MPGRLPRKVLHVMNAAGGGAASSTLGLIRQLRTHGVDLAAFEGINRGSAGTVLSLLGLLP